jgi:hypothetical protein
VQRRSLLARVVGATAVILAMTALASDSIAGDLTDAADFRVRVQAALRLGRQGGAGARAELERGLRDSHPAVRASCAVALGTIGDASAIPAITQAIRSESSPAVKTAMEESVAKLRAAGRSGGDPTSGVENAKYVVQLGTMRNNTGVRVGDLDGVMQQAARSKAKSIKGAVVVEGSSDASVLKRANERRIPVLLLDGNLTRLTQTRGRDGGVIVTAQVDLSVRRVPQQTLKGTVSGNASASDDARVTQKAILELQNRAIGGAMESAVSSVGSVIAALAK